MSFTSIVCVLLLISNKFKMNLEGVEGDSESEDGLSLKLVDESANQTKLDYYIFNTGTKNRVHNNTTWHFSF